MAGAKHTNRHLQRLMLRGLVLPAAAAGAIVLGASAASADEGTGPVQHESVATDVQSSVEAAGTTVTSVAEAAEPAETTEAEPPTPSPARQPSSGPGSGGSVEQVDETAASASEAVVARKDREAPPVGASASASSDTLPVEPLGAEPLGAEALPTEALSTDTERTESRRTDAQRTESQPTESQPAQALPTKMLPAEVSPTREAPPAELSADKLAAGATATVGAAVDRTPDDTAPPADQPTLLTDDDPLSDPLPGAIEETTPVFDRLLDESAAAAPLLAVPASAVDRTDIPAVDLVPTLTEPVRDFEPLAGPRFAPVTDTVSGLTQQALAPAAATTPIFTGVADSLLADIGDVATGTTGRVLAPLTEPTPLFDRLTREFLAPLPTIALPGFDPASGSAASTRPAGPTWQPSASPDAPPASAASAWTADWAPVHGVPGSMTGVTTSDATPAPTVVPPLVRSLLTHEPDLIESGRDDGRGFDHSAWPVPLATGSAPVDGAVDPLPGPARNLLGEVGGLVEAVTSAGGGQQGASGSVLLLLMAVLGAVLLLHANGLAQLTPGTATALSSRAAQVQDRPG